MQRLEVEDASGPVTTESVQLAATPLWRRKAFKIGLVVAVATAVVVGVAVAISVMSSASSRNLNMPETFAANFGLTGKDGSSATGGLHKTVNAKGEWVLSGAVVVSNSKQTTVVVAAKDGGVYYTVLAGDVVVEQSCVDPDRGAPHLATLQTVLESVKSVQDSREGSDMELPTGCTADAAWSFVFQGMPMVICRTQTGAFLVAGAGASGSVFDIDDSVSSDSPYEPLVNVTTSLAMKCPPILPALSSAQHLRRLSKLAVAPKIVAVVTRAVATSTSTASGGNNCQTDPDGSKWCIFDRADGRYRCRVDGVEDCRGPLNPGRDSANPPQDSSSFSGPQSQQRGTSGTSGTTGTTTGTRSLLQESASLPTFRRCVFVHGAGVKAGPVLSSFPEYWGQVDEHVSCASRVFLQLDTTSQGWDSPQLQQAFCDAASVNKVIRNTVVFAHSSGNLIIAGAIANNKCSFDSSSAWVELQASYNAARLGELAVATCMDRVYWDERQPALDAQQNLCVTDSTVATPGWASLVSTYTPTGVTWDQVATIIKTSVVGAMCGDYSAGLLESTAYSVTRKLDVHDSTDVAWSTCWDPEFHSQFIVDDFGSLFYAPSVNFWDVTCRNGNGMYGSHRRPCDWFGAIAHE